MFNVGEDAKRRGMTTAEMVSAVDAGLKLNGWFVTGRVDASLFSESFFFSDPQVSGAYRTNEATPAVRCCCPLLTRYYWCPRVFFPTPINCVLDASV